MLNVINNMSVDYLEKLDFKQLIRMLNVLQYRNTISWKFICSVNLGHPKSEIERIKINHRNFGRTDIEVLTSFFGIVGPTGVLPSHYTDYIISCNKEKNFSAYDFLNLFYNKIIKLFSLIIEKNDLFIDKEKEILSQGAYKSDNWLLINNLAGFSIAESSIPNFLTNYAGLLINRSRSILSLKIILSHYLQLPIEIGQFAEEKVPLERNELSRLGVQNSKLGDSFYIGSYGYFNSNKIVIKIFDIDYITYEKYLGKGNYAEVIHQILKAFLDKHIKYALIFLIKAEEKITLLSTHKPRKLGFNIWCKY